MAKDHTVAYVARIPNCDLLHTVPTPAEYDIRLAVGVWASVCGDHFVTEYGELGLGKGQRYILGEPSAVSFAEQQAEVDAAIASGDLDAFFEACGDRDPMEFL